MASPSNGAPEHDPAAAPRDLSQRLRQLEEFRIAIERLRRERAEKIAEFKAFTPLKRIGQPEEIAAAIGYLADSLFMTGETLDINGGWFMR